MIRSNLYLSIYGLKMKTNHWLDWATAASFWMFTHSIKLLTDLENKNNISTNTIIVIISSDWIDDGFVLVWIKIVNMNR